MRDSTEVAAKLKEQARNAICADDASVRLSSQLIESELSLFQTLQANLNDLNIECARILLQLPEAFVVSIKGIGITLAALV